MKVWIKRACGHEEQIDVFGKQSERCRRVEKEEKKSCRNCYEAGKYTDCDEVKMSYSDYKKNHEGCKTKHDSYDKKEKTIIVYVPKNATEAKSNAESESIDNRAKIIKKVADEIGLPFEELTKIFMTVSAEQFLKTTEENAEIMKKSKDMTGRYGNAYVAAIEMGETALKYGL